MLIFPLYVRTVWNDYFSGTSPTNLPSQTYTSKQTPSNTYVCVSNSLFRSITSTGHGGALYCSTSVTYLLVESTPFFSCKTSGGNGGAICFSNTNNGQCVLYEVCGYDCCTTDGSSVDFVCTFVNNGVSSKNYVNYSSFSRCINTNTWNTLGLYNGKICCPSVNSSMNKYYGHSILCHPFDSISVTCSLSYSSFADNIATYYNCIFFYKAAAKYEIKSCNILRNTQGTLDSEGTIYTEGYLTIDDSCILENKANYIFRSSSSSYTITLSNCTVDSTSNNGCLTIKNTVTKGFILALNHMSTLNCHSEYDSAGTLTPNIQTPSPSKKQIHCYTGWNSFYQCQLSNLYLISIIRVFLFNFIHLNAYSHPLY
jgi:hypothetical protein